MGLRVRTNASANNLLTRFNHVSKEAAIRITDGTENPSPPDESRSLIVGTLEFMCEDCQLKSDYVRIS
jgi:hypothetical protein